MPFDRPEARPTSDGSAIALSPLLWQLPSATFAAFLIAMVALRADALHGWSWLLLGGGMVLIAGATLWSLRPQQCTGPALTAPRLPILDLVGAVAINAVGFEHVRATILLCALPALWLAFEFGRVGLVWASGLTLAAAISPYAAGLDAPDTVVDLLVSTTPVCTVVILCAISAALGAQLRGSWDRELARSAEVDAALKLAQNRLLTMNGVLTSVNAAVAVLLVDEKPIYNQMATDLAIRGGLDLADPSSSTTLVFDQGGVRAVPPSEQVAQRALAGEEFSDVLHWFGAPGDQVAMVASARRLVDDDGVLLGTVVTAWDATELLHSTQVREEFLTTVSHELRTPLTSVIGYLELLRDRYADTAADPEAAHIVGVVSRNADLLLDRITQLLQASDGPETEHQPRRTDATALVRVAMEKHTVFAAAHRVQLDLAVRSEVMADLDPVRFEQVIDNLVVNAIKFSSPDGRVVVQLEADDSHLRLRVSDDGVGMTPDEQQHAFQRFFRADGATRNAIPGLGIGLGLVATIVERHRGTVDLASAPGHGTRVSVQLPLRQRLDGRGVAGESVNVGGLSAEEN